MARLNVRRAILTSPAESSAQWAVLVAISALVDPRTGIAVASIKTIAAITRFGRATVIRELNALEEAGVIERERRRYGNGGYRPTLIRLPNWRQADD